MFPEERTVSPKSGIAVKRICRRAPKLLILFNLLFIPTFDPIWLIAMEDEVRAVKNDLDVSLEQLLDEYALPPIDLSIDQVQAQVSSWRKD